MNDRESSARFYEGESIAFLSNEPKPQVYIYKYI